MKVKRPLEGRRIVVTRSQKLTRELSHKLQELGATTMELPSLDFWPPTSYREVDRAIETIESYHWILFTSVNGVHFFLNRVSEVGRTPEYLANPKVGAVGPKTAEELEKRGVRVNFVPAKYLTEELAAGVPGIRGERILLPRSDISDKALTTRLRKRGARVKEIVVYRTVTPSQKLRKPARVVKEADLILFTSPSSVKNFSRLIGNDDAKKWASSTAAACIGPVTASTAKKHGIPVRVVAKEHTVEGLISGIVSSFAEVK